MYEIDINPAELIVHVIIKLYIIINAVKLGWCVEIYDDRLVLTKRSILLTRLDKDTPRLISSLLLYD